MRLDFPWVAVPRQRRQLVPYRMAKQRLQRPSPNLRQLPNRADADLGQPRLGDRAHSPHQLDREVVKEIELSLGIDDHQPVGFGHLRGDFREVLSARHSDRDRKSQLRSHAASDRFRNFGRRTKEMDAARDIGKGLVDGNPFDKGREVTQYRDGGVAQLLVLLEMATDKSEVRTELTRPPSRHPAADAEGLGFVRSGKNNPATNRDRPAAQRRVEQLLDRSVEGVQVRMEDSGYRFHPDSLFARCLKWAALIETSEHK